ncbi:MAG: DUF3108 domain-containing protein [Gammaproteobacteria bacterium]|jgi:hypothetical protein|nr:DUF3108 domain-containing protein [Gammaproteobacteria bacterium]MBT5541528.1 DUF3108 domain-containing protein [Gammaproteobacteria bacterium]
MKKITLLFLSLIFTNTFALSPYIGSYDLYADTKMGNLKIGSAILNLEMNDSEFTFITEAKTESLWKALYDYSRSEKSTGNESNGQIINKYFSVTEKIKGKIKNDYEITIVTDKNYALSSTGEEFEIKPGVLVDSLSVYLALSNDMLNNPDQSEFTYQVVDQDGVRYLKFIVDGQENISINDNEINTIRVTCEELELTLNLSIKDNFQPVKIHKVNGKTKFTMLLIEFRS